jgi:hypothetical protein
MRRYELKRKTVLVELGRDGLVKLQQTACLILTKRRGGGLRLADSVVLFFFFSIFKVRFKGGFER